MAEAEVKVARPAADNHGGDGHPASSWSTFPAGLRLLVVDDDPLCLKVVEQMLRRCKYEVTTCANATSALSLLREKNSEYDLVLSDVYMPDMDGFKLLEVVGLEMDLPVIMMSSNGDTNNVLRGVTHGACDYLIKPVRLEELRNLWQHVVRRRRQHVMDLDSDEQSQERDDDCQAARNKRKAEASPPAGEQGLMNGARGNGTPGPGPAAGGLVGALSGGMGDDMLYENGSNKKARVVWSTEMHMKFVNAVNQLGIDKAVPKKILEIMNTDGLTRENVASHLQKYRLYLKRVSGHQHQHAQQQQQPGSAQARTGKQQQQGGAHGGQGGQPGGAAGGERQAGGQGQAGAAAAAQQPGSDAGHGALQPPNPGPAPPPPGGGFPPPLMGPGPMGVPGPMGLLGNPAAAAAAAAAGLNPLLGPMGGLGVGPMSSMNPLGPMPMPPSLGLLPGMAGGPMGGGPMGLPGLPMPLNPLNGLQQMAAANFMQGMASMGSLPAMNGLMGAMAGMSLPGAAQQQAHMLAQQQQAHMQAAAQQHAHAQQAQVHMQAAAHQAQQAAAAAQVPLPGMDMSGCGGGLPQPGLHSMNHGPGSSASLPLPPSDPHAAFPAMPGQGLHDPGLGLGELGGGLERAGGRPPRSNRNSLDLPIPLSADLVTGLLADGPFGPPGGPDLMPQPHGAGGVGGVQGGVSGSGLDPSAVLLGSGADAEVVDMSNVFGDMSGLGVGVGGHHGSHSGAQGLAGCGGSTGGELMVGDGAGLSGLGLGGGGDPSKMAITDDDFFSFLLSK